MIFWELIATIFAGFLFAGIALSIRLFYKRTPKWIVPVAAALGMLSFQIHHEYTWSEHTISQLPKGSVVIAQVPTSTWFRPWSYIKPQVFQFVVLDTNHIAHQGNYKLATLYFFERRNSAYPLNIQVDCNNPQLQFNQSTNDAIISALCTNR